MVLWTFQRVSVQELRQLRLLALSVLCLRYVHFVGFFPLVTHVLRFYSAELWSRFHFLYPMNSRYIILDTDKRTTMSSLIFVFDLCNYSFCSEYYMHINLQLTIILVIITIENISKVELWILICSLNFFFPVDCLSYDTMGQGKSQLYCSGTHYICW